MLEILFYIGVAAFLLWLIWPQTPRPRRKKNMPKITRQTKIAYSGMTETDLAYKVARLTIITYFLLRLFERFAL